MKKFNLCLCILIIAALISSHISAQNAIQNKKVSITYTWYRISSHGSNQIAVWIEDVEGSHICTLFATRFTASGGYVKRPLSLSEWTSKFDIKNKSKGEVDAITGATPKAGKQVLVWNGKDKSGNSIPAGTYVMRMEANIHNADKMFFRGEIKIGGTNQETTGKITYSSSNLATGEVLFSDVLVEYK